MKTRIGLIVVFAVAIGACQQGAQESEESEKLVQEIRPEKGLKNSEIIRNPVSANQPEDTVNVAKLSFDELIYEFGRVTEGTVVEHTYQFTNTGKVPLIITDARSTCGCTVPKWPKEAIAPGEKGEINVRFNTTNKKNNQSKPITITANTYPKNTVLHIKGHVIPNTSNELARTKNDKQ